MFIHGRVKRRNVFMGIGGGAILLAPLLRAIRAEAAGQPPLRVLFVRLDHGIGGLGGATPVSASNDAIQSFARWLQPLNAVKQHVLLVNNLRGTYWGNAHDVSYSDTFTAHVPPNAPSFSTPRGISIDTLIARELASNPSDVATHLRALRVNVNKYNAATAPRLSYKENGGVIAQNDFFGSGQAAFNAVVNGTSFPSMSATPPPVDLDKLRRKAVLDGIRDDANLLSGRLSGAEKAKLQYHLDSISETKLALGLGDAPSTPPPTLAECSRPPTPGSFANYELQLDAALLAIKTGFLCNSFPIAMLNIGEFNMMDNFTWDDHNGMSKTGWPSGDFGAQTGDFHQIVAHYTAGERRAAYEATVAWYMQKFAAFIASLANIQEGSGTVLDNTIIAIGGEIGDGQHLTTRKPWLLAGRGGSKWRTGRVLDLPLLPVSSNRTLLNFENENIQYGYNNNEWNRVGERSEADLWVAIANAMGVNISSFGAPQRNRGALDFT